MLLVQHEYEKYFNIWTRAASYRVVSPAFDRHLRKIDEYLQLNPEQTLIDYGCGTGRASAYYNDVGMHVTAIDHVREAFEFHGEVPFIQANLWMLDETIPYSDFGICVDVMEHIPRECLAATLEGIAKHSKRVYFNIAHFQDQYTHWITDGDDLGALHQTVEPWAWWRELITPYFKPIFIDEDYRETSFSAESKLWQEKPPSD